MSPPPRKPSVADEVADLNLPFDAALSNAKAASEQGANIAYRLAELLRSELERPSSRSVPRIVRLLELLSGLGCDSYVLPVRSFLLSDTDPSIRSKGTLMVGRASKTVASISRRLLDPDPRVQANAVEGLWGIDTAEAREHLLSALRSPHNRVVANALVGLYRMQDLASVPKLFAMAGHPDDKFRISARWAMGETGDPRFIPFLQSAFKTDDQGCRGMTLRSLKRLRQRLASLEQCGPLHIRALGSSILPERLREIRFSILRRPEEGPLLIRPTDVVVSEGSRFIHEFTLLRLPDPDIFAFGFAVPRVLSQDDPYRVATERGLEQTLSVKPKPDLWILDRYRYGDQTSADLSGSLAEVDELPAVTHHRRLNRGFLTDPLLIEKLIPGPGPRETASLDMVASIRKLMNAVGRISGARHIFVFLDPEPAAAGLDTSRLIQEANEAALSVHGIVTTAVSDYEDVKVLCEATGGCLHRLPSEEIAEQIPKIYQSLRNRYRITYPMQVPEPGETSAELTVYARDGWGRGAVDLR